MKEQIIEQKTSFELYIQKYEERLKNAEAAGLRLDAFKQLKLFVEEPTTEFHQFLNNFRIHDKTVSTLDIFDDDPIESLLLEFGGSSKDYISLEATKWFHLGEFWQRVSSEDAIKIINHYNNLLEK